MIGIRHVAFMGDTIQVEYMDPDRDVRAQGNSFLHATVVFNADDERWREQLELAEEAVRDLLTTVLAVHYSSPAWAIEQEALAAEDEGGDDDGDG